MPLRPLSGRAPGYHQRFSKSFSEDFAVFRSHPLLARIAVFLLVPLTIGLVFVNWYFRQSLPREEAVLTVAKLAHQVSVRRDPHGVPSIAADNEHDVYYAMGYLHAQDRMWQMEIQRRMVQGRLSEVLGEEYLQQDIWFRTLDLTSSAAAAMPALSDEAQESLRAYADGVNAWLDATPALPPEFNALSMRPARWTPVDSLSVVKLLALNLGGNYGRELEHFLAGRLLSPVDMKALFPGYPAHGPTVIQSAGHGDAIAGLQRLHDLKTDIQAKWQIGGRFVGSNAWVVAGRFMANGQAVLANDPHTGLQIPSIWYPVVQKGGRLAVSGMSLVGLPVIVFGKNQQVAWGGTNMMADVQDLYFEQVDGSDRAKYRTGSGWKEFGTRTEKFQVKAAFPSQLRPLIKPVEVQIRTSEHGPIISDVIGAFDMPVALRWVALDKGDTTYESFFRLSYARDWKTFNDALRFHVAPALNIVYIDQSKNIGYVGVGRIPVRARGNGSVPSPGWSGDYSWTGYIPFDALPRTYNPPEGYIVSANNRIVGDNYPYFISNDWAPPQRAQRIISMLEERMRTGVPMTPDDMKRIQLDQQDGESQHLLSVLTSLSPKTPRQREALRVLADWRGNMGADSAGAAIYAVWRRHLKERLFGEALRGNWNRSFEQLYLDAAAENVPEESLIAALKTPNSQWCGAQNTVRDCEQVLRLTLDSSLRELEKLQGKQISDWTWGAVHKMAFQHTPFSEVKVLDKIFGRKLPNGGSVETVNVADMNYKASVGYEQRLGATFRQIIQFDDYQFINSTGQSGHPLSPHYDDMMQLYNRGQYVHFSSAQASTQVLTLVPKDSRKD